MRGEEISSVSRHCVGAFHSGRTRDRFDRSRLLVLFGANPRNVRQPLALPKECSFQQSTSEVKEKQ